MKIEWFQKQWMGMRERWMAMQPGLRKAYRSSRLRRMKVVGLRRIRGNAHARRVFKGWRSFKAEVYESLLAAEKEPDKRILGEALTFQSDLVHLLDEPLPRGLRGAIWSAILKGAGRRQRKKSDAAPSACETMRSSA
jgi:hypothetical protein